METEQNGFKKKTGKNARIQVITTDQFKKTFQKVAREKFPFASDSQAAEQVLKDFIEKAQS